MTTTRTTQAPETRTPADVLRAAALVIEERGWCQRTYHDDAGRLCANAALQQVVGEHPWTVAQSEMYDSVGEAFRSAIGESSMPFNDTPGRTRDEVLAALRAAADASEVRG